MKIRFAAALFALALPLCAQDPAAAEALFYKAYWLQNGERNFAEAMTLYDKFLQQAPDHALVARAAQFQFELLTRAGKTEEAKTFAAKYEKVLGKVSVPAAGAGAGEGRGEGRGRGAEGGDAQTRLAELKKQLEEAKASGDQEQVARLERQVRRLEQGGGEAGAAGGQGGRGNRGGGMFGTKKLTEMSTEELDQFKTGLDRMSGMVERMREANPDGAKAMEENMTALQKALDENKLEDAQKALDKIRESMPRGRRGGGGAGGGEAGGGRGAGGGGRPAGGGGGGGEGGGGGGGR